MSARAWSWVHRFVIDLTQLVPVDDGVEFRTVDPGEGETHWESFASAREAAAERRLRGCVIDDFGEFYRVLNGDCQRDFSSMARTLGVTFHNG